MHDKGNNLKNLSSNISETKEIVVVAENGIIEDKKLFLFNGQIISQKKKWGEWIISFEQLNIDLGNLTTTTIKKPKIQETSTIKLFDCLSSNSNLDKDCDQNFKKEIIPTLNRRIITPFYIPILSLICSLLLIKSQRFFLNNFSIFSYSFALLLFTELGVRYTGIYNFIMIFFMIIPIILLVIIYSFLNFKFKREACS